MHTSTINYQAGSIGLLSIFAELNDHDVSEIMVNKPHEYWVEKNNQMFVKKEERLTPLFLKKLFQLIANENNQVISDAMPLLSGNLHDQLRVQLCVSPVAKHHVMSIRKKVLDNLFLSSFDTQYFDMTLHSNEQTEKESAQLFDEKNIRPFLSHLIKCKKTIVISGATSSGKTTLLNSMLKEIPKTERIITLEDAREIIVDQPNHVSLSCVKSDAAIITMQDLVQASLRLRPDRIIMGEIRGREVFDFVSSCQTGHEGSMTTIHANSPATAIARMCQLYKLNNVPSMSDAQIKTEILNAVDVIVQLKKSDHGRQITDLFINDNKTGDNK